MSEQITFATSDFASNPEPRCPCILLLDVSGSMNGRPINELNAGLVTFRDELLADPLALKRVELGIVTFGPVHVEQPFTSAANFFPPILFAQGDTPMGAAITKALDMVEERKRGGGCQLTEVVYDGVFEVLQGLLFLSAVPPVQLLTGW
ncbi:hypothetical protein OHF12_22145, partial [Escherichia coli]|nr:hypothetical protein [Escherichia coli]